MDIMSDSEEKTPTFSPDQAATSETVGMATQKMADSPFLLLVHFHPGDEMSGEDVEWDVILRMLDNIKARDPEAYGDILIETLFKHFARENRSKKSEKPDFLNLDR